MSHEAKSAAAATPSRSGRSTASPQRAARPAPDGQPLPAVLQAGLERLSGLALDAVRVHYDAPEPARLGALAYARGHAIHLAPGQQHQLPHEAWHVVQQAQGRVRPTLTAAGGEPVNDDPALEREADRMGERALRSGAVDRPLPGGRALPAARSAASVVQRVGITAVEEQKIFSDNHRARSAAHALERFKATGRGCFTSYVKSGQALDIRQTNGDVPVGRGRATDTAWVPMSPVFAVRPLAAAPGGPPRFRVTEDANARVQVKGNVVPNQGRRGFTFLPTGINRSAPGDRTFDVSGPPWQFAVGGPAAPRAPLAAPAPEVVAEPAAEPAVEPVVAQAIEPVAETVEPPAALTAPTPAPANRRRRRRNAGRRK